MSKKLSPAKRFFATYDAYLEKLKNHIHHTKKKTWCDGVLVEPRMPLSKKQKWWLYRLVIVALRTDEKNFDAECNKRRLEVERHHTEDIWPGKPMMNKAVKAGTLKRRKKA